MVSTSVMFSVGSHDGNTRIDLIKNLGFPDPFAVATLGGEQTKTTAVIKRTLNPYWNESFDL